MDLKYDVLEPPNTRVKYCRLSRQDSAWLSSALMTILLDVTEASVDPSSEAWAAVTTPNADLWGRNQSYQQANSLVSVLAGCLRKLELGLDLSERQLQYVSRIGQIADQLTTRQSRFTFSRRDV